MVASESLLLHSAAEDRVGQRLAQKLLAKAGKVAATGKSGDEPITKSDAEAAAAILEKGDGEDPLAAKRKKEASVHQGAPPGETGYTPPPRPLTFGQRYWPSLTAGAVGVTLLAVGLGFGVMSSSNQSDARDTKSQAEAVGFLNDAHQNAKIANIMFGVGGGVLAVGAVLLVIELVGARNERRRLEQPTPEPRNTEPRGVRAPTFQLGFTANGAGIFARGEF